MSCAGPGGARRGLSCGVLDLGVTASTFTSPLRRGGLDALRPGLLDGVPAAGDDRRGQHDRREQHGQR
ncbi:hypothetical protein K7G98_25910 [Saccharothrix sp. MB29]|nr:hypothetical protein [Saccharothrix sp. MB29]